MYGSSFSVHFILIVTYLLSSLPWSRQSLSHFLLAPVLLLEGVGHVKVVEELLLLDGVDGVHVDADGGRQAAAAHQPVLAPVLAVLVGVAALHLLGLLHQVHLDLAQLLLDVRLVDLHLLHHGPLGSYHGPGVQG